MAKQNAAKLAAMQNDAASLDADREKRLAALAEREREDRERDDAERMRKGKGMSGGGRADFVGEMYNKVQDRGLGERVGRSRGGLVRDEL